MQNEPNYKDLIKFTADEISELPIEMIKFMETELAKSIKVNKEIAANIHLAIKTKFDFDDEKIGTLKIFDGDYEIKQSVTKNVTYDQDTLKNKKNEIKNEWNDDPDDYISTTYKVDEKKYSGWPQKIKNHFYKARTVTPNKAKYTITKKVD